MDLTGNGWMWLGLALVLVLITFGGLAFYVILYLIAFIAGGLTIVYHYGKDAAASKMAKVRSDTLYVPHHNGISKIRGSMEQSTKIKNFDKRMTGASVIDDVLKEVLEYAVKDYIKTWYSQMSDHDNFLVDIWQCAQKVVITFSNRSKEVDWTPYFTQRLVDDFASHIRLFRRASDKVSSKMNEENTAALESAFFDMEVEMENDLCRDMVCLEPETERQYLQDLSEVLLFLLLPTEDFHNKPFRYIVREVLVNGIFLPTMDLISDPDYINQYIAWMCYETSFTRETFLTVVRSSTCMEELEAVRDKVDSDIAKWRSKDSGGSDDTTIKQNLNSLNFLRERCENRIRRILDGPSIDQIIEEPECMKYQSLYVLTLDDIFNNNVALRSFIEYMTSRNGQQYLFFYLNVEGFSAAAEQQLSEMQKQAQEDESAPEPDLEPLKRTAMIIYDQYLSEKGSSRIRIEPEIIKYTLQKIKSKKLSGDAFSTVQAKVYEILHCQYYEDFLQCPAYIKLLSDLGLLNPKPDEGDCMSIDEDGAAPACSESSVGSADESEAQMEDVAADTISIGSGCSVTSGGSPLGENYIFAQVTQSGIVKESDKSGKSYAVFAVTVKKKEQYSEEEEIWDVYRRYSDFHDLHMILTEKFPDMTIPRLPRKTVVKDTSASFLEKRRKDLDKYLRILMKQEYLQSVPGLEDLMNQFLHTGVWEKHKSEFSRKMDTIVKPLKTASKNVGSAVKSVPDGMSRLGDGIGKVFQSQNKLDQAKNRELMNQMKVGASLDIDAGENIPIRIMILLMDEVFDFRKENQWLRRRIVAILRQLVKATFGDKINRKIVEHVDFMTSSEQMAEYMTAFKNSFWPNGILAEPRPPRDEATKMRTRILCRAKMLGSVSDDVRRLMGTDAVRLGVARIFHMFQHKRLNKRLLYVILEGVLVQLFPDNKFPALFRKLHSQSSRAERIKEQKQSAASGSAAGSQDSQQQPKRTK